MELEYMKLRDEWASSPVRVMAERNLGKVCYNCGSDEGIELHHIVPLKLGGTNNISNIAVLCHRCHCAAHYGQHIRDYQNKANLTGRPHKVADEAITDAFEDLIAGKIGRAECKERLKLSQKSKISDMSAYKNFLKDRGIKSVKNNIDIIMNRRGFIKTGETIGYIEYKDGTIEDIYAK